MIKKTNKLTKIYRYILFSIIIFGSLVRLYKLTTLPLPPNGDELAFGYYGWSLFKFGTDEYGNSLPIFFSSIGDYKYPFLSYLNIIPAILFGLSDITARFWSALSGILLVPLISIISLLLFSNPIASLFTAFFIAISPAAITISRTGHEVNTGILLSSTAILLIIILVKIKNIHQNKLTILESKKLLRLINKKTIKSEKFSRTLFYISLLLLILSSFTYGTQKIFVPSFLAILSFFSYAKISAFSRIKKYLLILFILSTLISSLTLIPWQARGRASGVIYKGASQEKIDNNIFYDGISKIRTPILISRIFHNKISESFIETAVRYFNHFSPEFLFFSGDTSPETTPETGLLLHVEVLFVILGLLGIWKLNNEYKYLAYIWLISAPIASAITEGGPHLMRGSMMIPVLSLFSGYGLFYLFSLIKNFRFKNLIIASSVFLVLLNSSFVIHQIFVHKPVEKPWYSDQGKKELVTEILARKNDFEAVAMQEDPYIFFLFYGKITPKKFVSDSDILPEGKTNQWERVKRWSNIYFGMPYQCPRGGKLKVLYVCRGSEIPQNAIVLKTFYFLDGIPAYNLIEFFPFSEPPKDTQILSPMLKYMPEKESKYPDGIIPADNPSLW